MKKILSPLQPPFFYHVLFQHFPHASLSTIFMELVMISLEPTPPSSFNWHFFLEFLLTHMLQPSTNCNLAMITNNNYSQFIMGVLAQGKNGDEQFWKQKFHAANGKAQHAFKTQFFSASKPDFMFLIQDSTQKMVLRKMFGHTVHNLQTHYHLKAY